MQFSLERGLLVLLRTSVTRSTRGHRTGGCGELVDLDGLVWRFPAGRAESGIAACAELVP